MPRDLNAYPEVELEPWRVALIEAAEIIRQRWTQNHPGHIGAPRCAYGAIAEATGIQYGNRAYPSRELAYCEPAKRLSAALAEAFPNISARTRVAHWNDQQGQNAGNVAAVMESVALSGLLQP